MAMAVVAWHRALQIGPGVAEAYTVRWAVAMAMEVAMEVVAWHARGGGRWRWRWRWQQCDSRMCCSFVSPPLSPPPTWEERAEAEGAPALAEMRRGREWR